MPSLSFPLTGCVAHGFLASLPPILSQNFTRNDLKKIASYVMQDDLLNAYMTGMDIARTFNRTSTLPQARLKRFHRQALARVLTRPPTFSLLLRRISVQETLKFAAELRLPKDYTMEQRMERCAQVAEAMDVKRLYDVIIGNALMKVSELHSRWAGVRTEVARFH